MSNQTYIKKDHISFAQNLNEIITIAPSNITTKALYIGPNSGITYDALSNVQSINTLQGVTLSNQYIYADGTYLSNLPTTSGVTQSNINSTITGLGTFGYISSSQLISTVKGLGTFGYISTATLQSTITGLGATVLPSTIIGLGTFGYVSTSGILRTQIFIF